MATGDFRDKGLVALGALALAATAIGAAAVLSRYVFSQAFSVSDEVVTYLVVWGTLIAFGLGEMSNEHLRATILLDRLDPGARRVLGGVSLALALLFAAMLVYYGIEVAWQRYEFNEVSPTTLRFPQWIVRAAVPAGFLVAFLGLAARALGRRGGEGR